jgi:uncharacterized RDD family membrane protein YckC
MLPEVVSILRPIIGLPNCRTDVGEHKSLSFGFGERVYHGNNRLRTSFYGEWEIGTYHSAWRVVKGNSILLARGDLGSSEYLAARLSQIPLGSILALLQPSPLDLRIELNNDVIVEIYANTSDPEDDFFHMFFPKKKHFGVSAGVCGLSRILTSLRVNRTRSDLLENDSGRIGPRTVMRVQARSKNRTLTEDSRQYIYPMKRYLYRIGYFLGLALFSYDLWTYSSRPSVGRELYLNGREHIAMSLWEGVWVIFVVYITLFSLYHFIVNRQKPILLWLAVVLVPVIGAYFYFEKFIVKAGLLYPPVWRFKLSRELTDKEIARTSIRRFGAAFFDYGLFLSVALAFAFIFGTANSHGAIAVRDKQALPVVIVWFAYFPLAEFFFGSTLGKGIFGLKVVHGDGSNVSMVASLRRHAVDFFDVFFFVFICFVRVIGSGRLPRRLGDYWGHTWVVLKREKAETNSGMVRIE